MTTPNSATHGAADAALSFSTTPRNLMNYVTHNTAEIPFESTWLQGETSATFKELTSLFGKPEAGDGYKVDAEWRIKYEDGTLATIYNWKNGKNYCGAEGLPTEQITDWHIGGTSKAAVDRVQITLDLHREQAEESKPKDKFTEAFGSAIEIMDTIKAAHGQMYADAVEVALLCRKQSELVTLLASVMVQTKVIPEQAVDALMSANSAIQAKIIAKVAKHAGVKDVKPDAERLMNWAERLEEAEQSAAKTLFKDLLKDE